MSLQTTLENYYNSRKRHASEDVKKVSEKVMILDKNVSDTYVENDFQKRAIIYRESPKPSSISKSNTAPKLQRRTPKTVSRSFIRGYEENSFNKSSVNKSLLSSFNASELKDNRIKKEILGNMKAKKSLLSSFEVASSSGKKCELVNKIETELLEPECTIEKASCSTEVILQKTEESEKPIIDGETVKTSRNKTLDKLNKNNADLNLSALKKKIIKSSRLEDLKKALKKVNEEQIKLKEIQTKNQTTPTKGPTLKHNKITPTGSPTLKHFKAFELEYTSPSKMSSTENSKVPDSPSLLRRSLFLSPRKTAPNPQPYISPKKLFADSFNSAVQKSPELTSNKQRAFERFHALVSSGKPAFTLSYNYRLLAETFRSVDTVVSIMQNRNEMVLFSKLKSSVQQMSKKNLNESHLGQIATIFPKAFSFSQEKIRVFGNQKETYELVVKPVFGIREDKVKDIMPPSVLLERKRHFYNALLDIAKNHHEEFLRTLDPPLEIPKDKLTRWHPAFDLESCPEIEAAPLPQPPNVEKFTSARDVLNKARDMFVANPRMEKALEKLSEKNSTTTTTSKTIPALANALKGIPKSLLEKVRARQAAKAMELLTRNPEENKRRYELTRLPELARLLRNIFVTEKRNILAKPVIIQKLCESYREILDQTDMAHHLDLLREAVPGWIILSVIENKEFVKLCKQTDLFEVLNTINQLIAKNRLN